MKLEKKHPLIAVRRAGVPLVAIETSDPAQTIVSSVKALNGKANTIAHLEWDIVRGLQGTNSKGNTLVSKLTTECGQQATQDPMLTLNLLRGENLPKGTDFLNGAVCFFKNGHRFVQHETVMQALWNLRDAWKTLGATLVLLCPAIRLPDELTHDIVVVTEPLPDADEVGAIVDTIAKDAGLKTVENRDRVIDTLLGVSAFAAEQALAMSITQKDGGLTIDRDELWERKRKMVEQTPGLSVFRDGGSFKDIGGLDNIKSFLTSILTSGRNPVRCVGFIDEIEKMFAGNAGDLSGVSQDQLKVFLTEMQDHNIPGLILIGPPGTGKSAIAKATGHVADAEVLTIDTGSMTGSLVGESQAKIRKAMQTFQAVSQGKGMFIATCNKIASLPPELRRRFTLGTFYVDLPTAEERSTIWPLWLSKYSLPTDSARPDDDGWTGAEIRACCDVAYRANISLVEAAKFIVPVGKSAADQIETLRRQASGRFISASYPGIYEFNPESTTKSAKASRKFNA